MQTEEEWFNMRERYRKGVSISQIARKEYLDRKTVRKYVQGNKPPRYCRKRSKKSKLDPYKDYIKKRLGRFPLTAQKLFEEIKEL